VLKPPEETTGTRVLFCSPKPEVWTYCSKFKKKKKETLGRERKLASDGAWYSSAIFQDLVDSFPT